ncbi:AT-hook motif nuclear-localized protein 20-like [Cryptomeria japonica]|uniref:AT-hook motif nuclear-localized protein 20-like n=1 Tax=Cryptomeria japonica TaxID=3369 RepID=UPI0027DA379F|nr:AT-hook motif nuclear-localized protein 20-like [Cryptomeria japonica]
MHHSSSQLPQSVEAPPMDETVPDDAADTITITRTILEVPRRPRGRPPGSKNKPKRLKIVSNMAENCLRSLVLEVAGGCDVAQSIANFARRRQIWVWVLSGNGIVTNVTLREPTNPRAGVTVKGMYQIQYLSGMFSPGASSSGCGLTVLLVGMQGQVVGGSIIGPLIAAGPVIINAAFFIDAPQQTT